MENTTKRLIALQPGDEIVRILPARLQGPRGGRYETRGMSWRNRSESVRFERFELSRDGKQRTFYFENAFPLVVPSKLALIVRAEVRS